MLHWANTISARFPSGGLVLDWHLRRPRPCPRGRCAEKGFFERFEVADPLVLRALVRGRIMLSVARIREGYLGVAREKSEIEPLYACIHSNTYK
jgi:hypothetical protein